MKRLQRIEMVKTENGIIEMMRFAVRVPGMTENKFS